MSPVRDPSARVAAPAVRAGRESILDLWRGLALLDMVLVHLAWNGVGLPGPLDPIVKHYTRFAAGGFVLIAGLTIGTVFGPRVRGTLATRLTTYRWLWKRAVLLIAVDRLASAAMVLLEARRPFTGTAAGSPGWLEVLSFRAPGTTGGLLALYSLLLALTPLLFELSRRLGPLAVAALSLAGYAVANRLDGSWHWPPWSFPLASWQPLYVLGLFAWPFVAWVRVNPHRERVWGAISLACFCGVLLARFGADFGCAGLVERLALDFTKVPLRPGGLLWYLAASQCVLASSLAVWDWIPSFRPRLAWLAALGRHSLPIYVAHLFTEVPTVDLIWGVWPHPGVRVLLVVTDVVALILLANWLERGRVEPRRGRETRVGSWMPRPAWAACVAIAGSALALAVVRLIVVTDVSVPVSPHLAVEKDPGSVADLVDLDAEGRIGRRMPAAENEPSGAEPI